MSLKYVMKKEEIINLSLKNSIFITTNKSTIVISIFDQQNLNKNSNR